MHRDQIALQLWTVRRELASDRVGTLRAVAEAGYRAVEVAGLGDVPAARLGAELRDAGLRVVASHEGIEPLRANLGAVVERLANLGCDRAVVPWMPEEDRAAPDDVRRFAAELGGLAARLAEDGVRLGYHNHNFEFRRLGDATVWEHLTGALGGDVEIELDVHWAAAAGQDPVALIRQHASRVRLLHMKDRTADPTPRDAPPGEGVLPMAEIVAAGDAAGVEWYVVEQDEPADALRDVVVGLRHLEALASGPNA
jgi:sugar phosphate isomerase/epimerase